ncbi:39S ribosomal protein L35, mitochondrial [Galleria mellonella]|uniref:Large ribosomal subunit protein bL35m n=1 Tax=Galleria mellonella TaxID=7137 RepID=A0A6J1WJ32_GALME|nr:39S ribosomal protein L35, mitochondrial [Galleria mellonella]
MFRSIFCAVRNLRTFTVPYYKASIITKNVKSLCTYNNLQVTPKLQSFSNGSLSSNPQILALTNNIVVPIRTVTKFSLKKGKRKTVKAVTRRFFRLHWGGWIRPKVGRKKRLWKKSSAQKRRLRQHVLCNSTQSTLLDKMVTKFWKRPKYYVDDPYSPYHTREEFYITRRKPIVRN